MGNSQPPFYDRNVNVMYKRILHDHLLFPPTITGPARDLLSQVGPTPLECLPPLPSLLAACSFWSATQRLGWGRDPEMRRKSNGTRSLRI